MLCLKNKGVLNMDEKILHKEIDLIQTCIERMSKNSFSCKGWNLTLIAGVFALTSENINKLYLCVIILCINECFWCLDSYYLLQEQKYRDKYEWVIAKRIEGDMNYLYDLNPNNNNMSLNLQNRRTHLKAAFSKTILPIYGGIVILLIFFLLN